MILNQNKIAVPPIATCRYRTIVSTRLPFMLIENCNLQQDQYPELIVLLNNKITKSCDKTFVLSRTNKYFNLHWDLISLILTNAGFHIYEGVYHKIISWE